MNPYVSILMAFLILGCTKAKRSERLVSINSLTTEWNDATLKSLERQAKAAGAGLKDVYENRLEAFKAFNEIVADTINPNSVRYLFLRQFKLDRPNLYDFYIIEEKESGESVAIRNYIIYDNSDNVINVEVYNLINGEWLRNDTPYEMRLTLKENLSNYFANFGNGFNNDDVIITQVVGLHIKESQYYLYTTLSDENGIGQVFRRK